MSEYYPLFSKIRKIHLSWQLIIAEVSIPHEVYEMCESPISNKTIIVQGEILFCNWITDMNYEVN